MENSKIKIYCDGACSGNPGPGGWGAVLLWKQSKKEIYGSEALTTNNRMELTAAVMALENIKKDVEIEIYTDSMYLKNGITSWIINWKKNNWKKKGGELKNVDLWKKLDLLNGKFDISWNWVKAHSGDVYNEIADSLARQAITKNN